MWFIESLREKIYKITADACDKTIRAERLSFLERVITQLYKSDERRNSQLSNWFLHMKPVVSPEVLHEYQKAKRIYDQLENGEKLERAISILLGLTMSDEGFVYKDFHLLLGECYTRQGNYQYAAGSFKDAQSAQLWMDLERNSASLDKELEKSLQHALALAVGITE